MTLIFNILKVVKVLRTTHGLAHQSFAKNSNIYVTELILPTVPETSIPRTLRVKIFLNPPDVNGKYSLDKKRMWHFTQAEKDQLSLTPTINLFESYFRSSNSLELSYFDGDEEMPIVKDEDLKEACMYFVQCYRDFDNYQDFLKIYVKETLKQASSHVTAKLPKGTSRHASNLYKQLTTGRSSNVADLKLEKMKVKVSKEFNASEVQAEVLSKVAIKCTNCKKVVKLGKPHNVHNFKKHLRRCSKTDTIGMQSISTLFLALTAIAQQVKSKAVRMIAECNTLKDNGRMVDAPIKSLQQVVEKPSSLESVAEEIKHQTLEAVESEEHPLYNHFIDLCIAGKIDMESVSSENAATSSSSTDGESDDASDNSL